jgi:hypothetical protein
VTNSTPIDTADASTFLRSVNAADGTFSEHFLMPITGFENSGQPAIPKGFMDKYDLYLTLDASGTGPTFDTLNVTLWADPKGNDGPVRVDETHDPSFAHGTRGDIALATGTEISANLMQDSTGTRHANFVESLTPTAIGSVLSGGALKAGMLMQESLTSPANVLSAIPQSDGITINLLKGGTAKIDFPSIDTVQYTNNVFSIVQPDGTFQAHRIDPVTGFVLSANPVIPAGFGTTYGLYFDITDTGTIGPGGQTFSSSTFKLMLDPGNQDGAVTATPDGIGFANTGTTGTQDDIVLGTGTMISGVATIDPTTQARSTHFVDSYTPGDFNALSPILSAPATFNFLNNTGASPLVATPGPNGTTIQTINGGEGAVTSVPEIGTGDTILIPNIPSHHLHHGMRFLSAL